MLDYNQHFRYNDSNECFGKKYKPPANLKRLAKLTVGIDTLNDQGFNGDNLSYPYFTMI